MTANTLTGLMKVMATTNPFYASDLNLNGGVVSALSSLNIIQRTGNQKEIMVELGDSGLYKKCFVNEWRLTPNYMVRDWTLNDLGREYKKAKDFVETYEKLFAL